MSHKGWGQKSAKKVSRIIWMTPKGKTKQRCIENYAFNLFNHFCYVSKLKQQILTALTEGNLYSKTRIYVYSLKNALESTIIDS